MKNLKFKVINKYLRPYKKEFSMGFSSLGSKYIERCNSS